MKPLKEKYDDYVRKRTTEIDAALRDAGLPPMGVNWLHPSADAYRGAILTFENYAATSDEAMSGLANAGFKHRKEQSDKAKKPRGKVGEDEETLSEIIGRLALCGDQEESAKALWRKFYGELDRLLLDPVEKEHPTELQKSSYEYTPDKGRRKKITFGYFAGVVSAFRKGK